MRHLTNSVTQSRSGSLIKAAFIGSAALFSSLAWAPISNAAELVTLNKTHMLRLSQPAAAVIVGDPNIADVSVHADNILFLLGRSYGETDLLVLDSYGNTIMKTDITVIGPSSTSRVNLIEVGVGRESYHCNPKCEASPKLGDSNEFIGLNSSTEAPITNGTASLSTRPAPQQAGSFSGSQFSENSSDAYTSGY